eukprot:TRINITY_DN4086_c0_g1_i1.p1 TRINITY_DN4086_c0_g1~~TRINITY_DN4086_c0_g1_i1.p1  ORF type:complete len:4151 (+),score=615.43 TRINITY_DN4086_c0_g1_i1:13469-25921(+)
MIRRPREDSKVKVQNKTFAETTKPIPQEEPHKEALLQGKKHAENPWIQKVASKEERASRSFIKRTATSQKKPQEATTGLKETDKEAEVIAEEFNLPIFQVLDKREYRQLISYDTWTSDLSPEVWVERCRSSSQPAHGVSPVYDGTGYMWQPVKILGYEPSCKKFRVVVIETGQEKLVARLSLMFYEEDHELFNARLQECRERRENVEGELRFQNYVDSLPSGLVTHIPPKLLEEVFFRAVQKGDNVDKKHSEATMGRLSRVIDAIYRRTMKKCLVLQSISNGTGIQRLEDLNIPVKFDAKSTPYMAVIDVGRNTRRRKTVTNNDCLWAGDEFSYIKNPQEHRSFIKGLPKLEKKSTKMADFKAKRKERKLAFIKESEKELLKYAGATTVINAFTDAFQKVCEDFKKRRLFQTESQRLQIPMRCSQFMNIQDKKINATTTDILNNWRFQILHDMREKLGNKFTFDIPEMQKYEESPVRKIIRKFDLMFHNHLEELYLSSIKDFVEFMQSFTQPTETGLWKISSLPLVEIDIRYTGSDKKKDKKKEDAKRKKEDKRKKELKKKERKELLFKPDINQCKKDILSLFEKIVASSKKVTILETEDFNVFLSERKTPAVALGMDTPAIVEARNKIEQFLDQCIIGPKELLARFKKYEFLMESDVSAFRKIMDKEKPPTTAELKEQLNSLSKAGYEVKTLATDLVQFSMFQINTEMVKKYLAQRANKLKAGLLQAIQKHCKKSIADILNSYVQLLNKLEDKPTSKEAYKELKMYLKDSNKRMEELKARHELVKLHMDLLEDNLVKIDKDDERDFWKVHQYPGQLRSKIAKGNNNLINYEEQIRIELEKQKDLFDKDLNKYQNMLTEVITFNDIDSAKNKYRDAFELYEGIENTVAKAKDINDDEGLLEMKKTEYTILEKLSKDFQPFYTLIKLAEDIQMNIEGWKTNPFIGLKPSEIENDVKSWNSSLETLNKQLDEHKEQADVTLQLKSVVDDFTQHLELIKCLRSEAMKEEEFNEINKVTPLDLKVNDDTYSLNTLIKKNAGDYMEQIREIWERAERKLDLEKNLKRIKDDMHKKRLEVVKYPATNSYVIQGYEGIMEYIDEQIATTQAMLSSPYTTGVLRKNCVIWSGKFGTISETLEELRKCQKTWTYLEPIFSSEDIRLTLKLEAERFMEVDSKWKQQMDNINADNLVVSLLDKERLKEDFIRANADLDSVLKSLSDFFESKRKKFPRFYFISDEDMVKILSNAKQDPSTVEPYLSKCFDQMSSLEITQPKQEVVSVLSASNEEIELLRPLDLREGDKKGNVEMWLQELERILYETIKDTCRKSIKDYSVKPLAESIFAWPSQSILVANQVHFTAEVETALRDYKGRTKSMLQLEGKLKDRIMQYVEMVRSDLSPLNRSLVEALLVLDVHAKDVVRNLIDRNVSNETAFEWIAQMRYTIERDHKVKVHILTATQPYGYEYMGNPSRLVITPLTDRCYRTLIMAKQMNRGGALTGPAGSGKTETVKDLAKALGVYCVVFNGSDEADHLSLGKFFKGLASSGAWCCFDEFNKIPSDVLSVLASHILMIQQALGMEEKIFYFLEEEIVLNPQCGINITMNPSMNLHTDLPDNLKALFRPCVVTMPDDALIAEILLYSYGFQEPRTIAKKVVGVLKLCKEQLSACGHYDFGMRALKAVLVTAKEVKKMHPTEREEVIVRRALDDINLPKFTSDDAQLYEGIATDLFPGVTLEARDYGNLNKNIVEALQKERLQPKPEFIKKCLQLYETLAARHGILVIGESLSGKTTAIQALKNSLTKISSDQVPIKLQTLNPKAVTLKQLFGYFDSSHSWIDGVLAKALRDFADSNEKCQKWLVCDGPVDTTWMESINSVLDDNKKLCLSSGTAINLDSTVRMFFEVEDLKYASPAIVSRCGVVYMECLHLGWDILIKSYCETLPGILTQKRIKAIEDYMFSMIIPTVNFIAKHCKYPIQMKTMHVVKNFLNIVESYIADSREVGYKLPNDLDSALPNMIVFATIWSFGGVLEESMREKFKEYLLNLLNGIDVKIKYKLEVDFTPPKFIVKFPESQDPFKLFYDRKHNQWTPWSLPDTFSTLPKETLFHDLIVPTPESERMSSLLRLLVTNQKHLLFVGPSGTGKTICTHAELKTNFLNTKFTYLPVILSAQTTANQAQRTIESKLEKRGRKIYYGPLQGKRGVVFLDDLNMPQKDVYGAQPPIELFRQWMDHGGWYDIDSAERKFKYVTDITFVGAVTLPTSGRGDISMRYIRHYNVIYVDHYENTTLTNMFSEILNWKLKDGYEPEIQQVGAKIAEAAVNMYFTLQKESDLKPIPSKPHYAYNLRDVGKVFQGVLRATPLAIKKSEDLIKLWAHESMRIFHDRLTTTQDRDTFMGILKASVKTHFDQNWDMIVGDNSLIYCDFVPCIYPEDNKSKDPIPNLYCEVKDRNLLKTAADSYLAKYNTTHKSKLNIVLFASAIEHIVQIKRILSIPSGHALLVGVGSSGRKSLTALASFIGGFELFQIEGSRKYKTQEWHQDLRTLMTATGVDKTPTVFLLSDSQINDDNFLEDLNNLFNTGEVPNLYSKAEKVEGREDYMNKLRENMQSRHKKLFNTDEEILEVLKENSKQYLHVAFCMNPVGEDFRHRLRMFPSLINCTTINYFLPWPEEGLRSVASQSLCDIEGLDQQKDGIVSVCVDMQERVRLLAEKYKNDAQGYYYVTPASYLELLKIFKKLLQDKRSALINGIKAYENGLEELHKTEQFVAQMKVKLQELEPELKKKSENAAHLADSLKKKQMEVVEETKIVQKEQEKAEETKRTSDELQAECQADLDKALPELKEAEGQIGAIKQEAIANLAAMGSPPDEVRLVAKALCIILDIKPKKAPKSTELDYWIPKKIFTFKNIKWCTVGFDKENIPLAKITELHKINDNPSFAPEKLKSVSEPGEMLARWIRAIIKFDQVNREVAPKKIKLKEESEKAKAAHEAWASKSKQLEEKRNLLNELNQKSQSAEAQKKQLMQEIEGTRKKIDRARELLDLLKTENRRWNDQKADMQARHKNIVGDMLISSGIIAYLGIFPFSYRESCIASWSVILQKLGIAKTENYTLFNALGDPLQKLIWQKLKLPTDTVSTDNAIIIEKSTRWPLMIDPQLQAVDWIKRKGNVEVLKANQKIDYILKRLSSCMTSGTSVLLEDLDETIDSRLNPLLKKEITTEGRRNVIRLGEDIITITSSFAFYITTKLAKPHYSPEICSLVTMLNFSVTEEGLIEQALNIIVKKEEPNTEKSREDVINKNVDIKKKLKTLEEELLKIVTTHKEGILESEKLLETLKNTKTECQQFTMQVEEQKRVSERIENTRSKFRAVAKRVAELYFCVTELSVVEPMYQFSLDWYLALYRNALQSEHEKDQTEKLNFYKNKFTHLLFTSVCKSLFEKDKLLFTLSLYLKIVLSERNNSLEEVHFLAAGPTMFIDTQPNLIGGWMTDKAWRGICELSQKIPAFKELDKDIVNDLEGWRTVHSSADVSSSMLEKYNPLQRLILINTLRPDKFIEAAQQVICMTLGKEFCEYPPYNLEDSYTLSTHKKPIIIILSPGADPMEDLKALAIKKNLLHAVIPLSLGKGQGKAVKVAIDQATKSREGAWVILQNCHLATSYLSSIEKMLEELPDEPKLPFRLWLTTMPSNEFPVSLLQNSVKVTNEKPKGIVKNVADAFNGVDSRIFSETGPKADVTKKLVLSLCMFHATVLERGKFGTLGWNLPYDFSQADLLISVEQIRMLLKESDDIPWDAINYLIAEANYGGRISDPMDSRLIKSILSDFCTPEILKDNYRFCNLKEYIMPKTLKSKDDYIKYIRKVPQNDNPEIFGLSEAASITCLVNDASALQSMLLNLLPHSTKSSTEPEENKVFIKAENILKEIPKELDWEECLKKYPILYTDCLNSVLQQEAIKYNNLLRIVCTSLQDMQKALKGHIVMSKDLEEVAYSIHKNAVPELWQRHAYLSLKSLSSWVKDLIIGVQFFEDWIDKGHPTVYRIAAFFNPQAFLVALLQNYARKKQLAFDDLVFDHKVMGDDKELPTIENGGYLTGLYIEGATWNKEKGNLMEPEVGILFTPMPNILLAPVECSKQTILPNVFWLNCNTLGIRMPSVQNSKAEWSPDHRSCSIWEPHMHDQPTHS